MRGSAPGAPAGGDLARSPRPGKRLRCAPQSGPRPRRCIRCRWSPRRPRQREDRLRPLRRRDSLDPGLQVTNRRRLGSPPGNRRLCERGVNLAARRQHSRGPLLPHPRPAARPGDGHQDGRRRQHSRQPAGSPLGAGAGLGGLGGADAPPRRGRPRPRGPARPREAAPARPPGRSPAVQSPRRRLGADRRARRPGSRGRGPPARRRPRSRRAGRRRRPGRPGRPAAGSRRKSGRRTRETR